MLSWQGDGGRALESARVLLGGGGIRALGRMVRAPLDAPAFTASYRLFVDEDGVLARLSVTSATAERERNLTLNHTEDGYWLLDTGSGGSRAEFDGALDVDLQYSPLYNTLPIRRLGLHRESLDHELPMVFVSLPTLEVEVTEQRYRTVSTLDADGRSVVNFSAGTFVADITVDSDALVLDYPGIATRI
ncbi:putative glycolipid-binding domain-containing protein [Pseudonocardia acaciae]|uniref:putative glycolipid-binding domain-containing protein n=1 Tax=Pseudonocardia acaciae TaxID=551276 RepID=UPI00048DBF5C|nr:putative glycolipid-binding domain-containing protein [Pseudonocardia acaciae]